MLPRAAPQPSGGERREDSPRLKIDLNADIGESSADDAARSIQKLLQTITSGNVACGFHAGDPSLMRDTVRMALRAGVSIGAHPGFPDPAGFGRREMAMPPEDIAKVVLTQIQALSRIAEAKGARLRHVKPHGALYNMSVRRVDIAEAIAGAIAVFDKRLLLVGLPGSELLSAGKKFGLSVAAEGFADRSYEADGSLTPRNRPDAVLPDPADAAERAVRMVRDGKVIARDGSVLRVEIDTICVHGDTPGAPELAAAVRAALEEVGVEVKAL